MKNRNHKGNSKTSLLITVLVLTAVIFFARHQNTIAQTSVPAYQNQVDQGVETFKINEASKI